MEITLWMGMVWSGVKLMSTNGSQKDDHSKKMRVVWIACAIKKKTKGAEKGKKIKWKIKERIKTIKKKGKGKRENKDKGTCLAPCRTITGKRWACSTQTPRLRTSVQVS